MKNIENYLYEEAHIFNKALISQLSPKPVSTLSGKGNSSEHNKG